MSKATAPMVTVEVEVPRSLRDGASAAFKRSGITIPAAIRLFLTEVVHRQGMPFDEAVDTLGETATDDARSGARTGAAGRRRKGSPT